jgi:hypothetical protein
MKCRTAVLTHSSQATKSAIIQGYLKGKPRDANSLDLGPGGGTVSKAIEEWKRGLDFPEVEELRELAVQIRKLGIPASRFAEWARLASILVNLGVGDEQFRDFVSKLYTKCQKIGFQPERVGSLLDQLSGVSEPVPLDQIPEYIKELIDQVDKKSKKCTGSN